MVIGEVALIRTGIVVSRLKKETIQSQTSYYKVLNLKAVADEGYIIKENIEETELPCIEKENCFTQMGDILVRLSSPYTAVMIKEKELCDLVIPSHFAVIRVDKTKAIPEYVYWLLKRDKNIGRIILSSSGSTALGTISSGALANLPMKEISLSKQKAIGELLLLMEREQELLNKLSAQKEQFMKFNEKFFRQASFFFEKKSIVIKKKL